MPTLEEDITMLRNLVFNGAEIEWFEGVPLIAIKPEDLDGIYSLEHEATCPHCEQLFKPFLKEEQAGLVVVRTACDKHYREIFQGIAVDVVLEQVKKLIGARIMQQKFDQLCEQFPGLIQESFAYNRCFIDWLAMYDKLRLEKEKVERERDQLKSQREAVERKEVSCFKRWFTR